MSYLAGAYGIIWLAIFVYAFIIDRKVSRLEREIESLKK
ncbi:MAG: CcmD family protein [Nitrospinota bacterium]|nr:CcmD family protein [Nitrospinota bacterium]